MYSRSNSVGDGVRRFFTQGHMPLTTGIVVATVLHFILNFYVGGALIATGCTAAILPNLVGPVLPGIPHVWTLLTYPVAEVDFINCAFTCLWLWWVGGSLERSWSTPTYARFLAVLALATSLALWAGCRVLHVPFFELGGLMLPLVGLTVAWASLNPNEEILFYFVIRMKAWVLAILTIAIMLFITFHGNPPLGLFALANPFVAYIWVRGGFAYGLSTGFTPPRPTQRRGGPDLRIIDADRPPRKNVPLDDLRGTSRRGPLGVYQDWRQRKRLEKLWRDSGLSDSDERNRKP